MFRASPLCQNWDSAGWNCMCERVSFRTMCGILEKNANHAFFRCTLETVPTPPNPIQSSRTNPPYILLNVETWNKNPSAQTLKKKTGTNENGWRNHLSTSTLWSLQKFCSSPGWPLAESLHCEQEWRESPSQKKKNSSGVALQISLKVQKVTTSGMSKFIVSKPHRPNSGSARSPKCIWKNQIGCNSRPRNFGRIKNPTVGHPWPCFDDQAGGGVSRPSIKDQGSILSSLRNPWAHCNWVNLPRFNSHRSFNSNLMKICKLRRGCWGPEGGSGGGSQEGNGFFSRSCVKCSTPF